MNPEFLAKSTRPQHLRTIALGWSMTLPLIVKKTCESIFNSHPKIESLIALNQANEEISLNALSADLGNDASVDKKIGDSELLDHLKNVETIFSDMIKYGFVDFSLKSDVEYLSGLIDYRTAVENMNLDNKSQPRLGM